MKIQLNEKDIKQKQTSFLQKGFPQPVLFNNLGATPTQLRIIEEMQRDFIATFKPQVYKYFPIKDIEYLHYNLDSNELSIGYEPNYQGENYYKVVFSPKGKKWCTYFKGEAIAIWGTGIKLTKVRQYSQYLVGPKRLIKILTKFCQFFDKWYDTYKENFMNQESRGEKGNGK